MTHYFRKTLLFLSCLSAVAFCFKAQAQDEETTRRFMPAKLAYQDFLGLARYYEDDPEVTSTMARLHPVYLDACATGRLLGLVRLAQHVILELEEPEFAVDRFNDFLSFLEAGNEDTDYLMMLGLLEKAEFQKLAQNHPFWVTVLVRFAHVLGLAPQSPIAALREGAQGIVQDPLFMNNRDDLLQRVRAIFEDAEEEDVLVRIQNVIDMLTERFTTNALGLFNGIHEFIPALMERPLPSEHQNTRAARESRRRLYGHAINIQEALLDPQRQRRDLNRLGGEGLNADLRAGVVGGSFPPARL